jgi:hypothetical protein
MMSKPIANRLIIIGFMMLVGFSLAKAIYSQSVIGMILSIVSLVAGIYFLHLMERAKDEAETES